MTLVRESHSHMWRPFAIMAASAACVASTALVVDGYKTTHKPLRTMLDPPPRVIAATGTASRHVAPDKIKWEVTVTAHATDERDARRRAMAVAETARAFLANQDVHENEITLLPVEVEQAMRTVVHHTADGSEEQDDVPNGFDGTQTIRITSHDVARVVAAYRTATASLDIADIAQPQCTFSGLASIERELLPEARLALRQRLGATIKAVGGAQLGRLVASDTGSFDTSGFNDVSIESCERGADVSVSTSATFELK